MCSSRQGTPCGPLQVLTMAETSPVLGAQPSLFPCAAGQLTWSSSLEEAPDALGGPCGAPRASEQLPSLR